MALLLLKVADPGTMALQHRRISYEMNKISWFIETSRQITLFIQIHSLSTLLLSFCVLHEWNETLVVVLVMLTDRTNLLWRLEETHGCFPATLSSPSESRLDRLDVLCSQLRCWVGSNCCCLFRSAPRGAPLPPNSQNCSSEGRRYRPAGLDLWFAFLFENFYSGWQQAAKSILALLLVFPPPLVSPSCVCSLPLLASFGVILCHVLVMRRWWKLQEKGWLFHVFFFSGKGTSAHSKQTPVFFSDVFVFCQLCFSTISLISVKILPQKKVNNMSYCIVGWP